MNTKRLFFWLGFVVVLALIIWGLIAAMNKSASSSPSANYGTPAPVNANDHVRGPADAPVTLIEFADFECPACEQYEPVLEKLEAEASSTFKIIYRHFPLPQHPNALPAAYAAEAANLQGKFWDMHDLLMLNHTDWTEASDPMPVFTGYATKIGLDLTKFKADMASDVVKARVQTDADEAQSLGLNYTPTFFLNGKVISNPQNYGEFLSVIETAASSTAR